MGVIFSMGHTDISYVPGYLQCVSIHAFNHLTISTIRPSAVTVAVRWLNRSKLLVN